ncbi:DUF4229 domain-containing protein [Paenarthrobacter sp. DKR-5]|uniref:DUF4229 domain-containing protein n=1 Tax=Paenarthrobacter sp. DKR-5 TaxID=2835535 RepID=UPI001BDCC0F8|nr:DUF4229 domain-containing protein [Paenarthrobacter sp. DKR-5]MBT1001280.1 DUF4229 domain-containing protein [Paenarthrobacter sp. DKR-5]
MGFLKYFLIRFVLFLALFVLFYAVGLGVVYGSIAAAVVAFCISFLFLQKQRDAATSELRTRFAGKGHTVRGETEAQDADVEDALVDAHPDIAVDADRRAPKAKGL